MSRRVEETDALNLSKLKRPPVDVVWKIGEGRMHITSAIRQLSMVQNYEVRPKSPRVAEMYLHLASLVGFERCIRKLFHLKIYD
ncbi:hypothetical protein TNCV_3736111 [Trichonephila clavipes]|nr:hypothetical protein TNCV_3736111 [Trichonephila clavipes]